MKTFHFSHEALRGERPFRKYWNLVVLLGICWYAITVPLYIALGIDSRGWSLILDIFWTLFFSVDIYLNFNTSYLVEGEWITNKATIRRHYLRSWFALDFLATFPIDLLLFLFALNDPWMLGAIRLIRLLEVFRLFRLTDVVVNLSAQGKESLVTDVVLDANAQLKITLLIFWVIVGMNTIACGWLIISPQYRVGDFVTDYVTGLYWTITTLTTVGYGEIIPSGNLARIYTMVIMLGGVVMYGLVIGNISTVMINNKAHKIRQRDKVVELAHFLKDYRIPKRMQSSIFSYYNHYLFEKDSKHLDILKELPMELQHEINHYVNVFMLRRVPIFFHASQACLDDMAHCLKTHTIPPNEKIIQCGEVGKEMYFLNYGTVTVQTADGLTVAKLHSGAFFGEVALLEDVPRIATIQTVTFCDVFILNKKDFKRVTSTYPNFKEKLMHAADARQT